MSAGRSASPWLDERPAPNGRRICDNFRDWFGQSKVLAGGAPLMVFHGTASDLTPFDKEKLGNSAEHHTADFGFFFSSDARVAAIFNREYSHLDESDLITRGDTPYFDGANTMPVYLSIANPHRLTAQEFIEIVDDWSGKKVRAFTAKLRLQGHDGILIPRAEPYLNAEMVGDTWVAFYPEQIKSAISNSGNYDPMSPCIVDAGPAPALKPSTKGPAL